MEPPQNVSSQKTLTNASHNDLTNTHNGTGVSNAGGNFHVGGSVNINSYASPHPTAANDARKDLLESLQFDQIDARHDSIKKAHAKTCRWFLDTDVYKTWEETGSSHANNFLWIKGKPGAGKSTLMKFLHGQIRARTRRKNSTEILISFFFNARGHELEKSTLGLYRSLLWQLLDKRPGLQQQVLDGLRPGCHWTSESLKSLLDDAIQELGETPIFCLIDALDECDQDQIRDMVSFLEALVDVQSSVHVCFASRHYPHITIQTSLDIILEDRDGHEQDIATYLTSALRIKPKELADQIRAEIQEKAHGVFIWVVLVVDILNKEYDAGRKYRLRERLQELPGDLHLLFRDILTRDTNNRAGLLLCIQWVLFAKEPLTPRQLHLALLSGTEPEFLPRCHSELYLEDDLQRYILDISKGLAQPTKSERPTIQFIHESVRDFLLKENCLVELFDGLRSNLRGESHNALKGCCLAYMRMEELMRLCKNNRVFCDATQQFPFLEYANIGVLYHADKAGGYGINQESFIANFPRSQWVEQYRYSGGREFGSYRYQPDVSLFYILAREGLSELIRAHLCRQSCFEIEDGYEQYGVPILAALALGHEIAVQVMLELEAERIPGFDFAGFCKRFQSNQNSELHNWGRNCKFSRERKLLEELIIRTDDRMSLFILETTMECLGYDAPRSDNLFLLACKHERFESAKFLVQHCVNITNADGVNTPLHQASATGNLEMTEFLVNRGADISTANNDGNSPLYGAVCNGHLDIVQLLIDRGADISTANNDGNSPLHGAVCNGHLDIVQLLIDRGADISTANNDGNSPLHGAVCNGHLDIVQLLIDRGADISTANNDGNSPLYGAVCNGHLDIVQLLIDRGADMSTANNDGNTLLHQAAYNGKFHVAQLLINRGASLSAMNEKGETPLHQACQRFFGSGCSAIARLLVEYGANPSATTYYGQTPLHRMLLHSGFPNRRLELAKLLVDSGVDVSSPDNHGQTPLQMALDLCLTDMVDFLQSCGSESSASDPRH